jgi:PBP1b-binding outer membrane lipoprotein LpoB
VKSDGTVDYTKLGQKVIDQLRDASGSVDFASLAKVAVNIAQKDGAVKSTLANQNEVAVNKKSVAV